MAPVVLPMGFGKLLLHCCVLGLVLGTSKSNVHADSVLDSLRHVRVVDASNIETMVFDKLTIVYYFVPEATLPAASFLPAFDDAAAFLEAYNVLLTVVKCDGPATELDKCKEDSSIVAYRDGIQLINLDIDTMFNVDSVMANTLQLLLLREAPIIESQSDRDNLVLSALGSQDIILFYTTALGTTAHRVFMEIVYAYQDRYKFAVSTTFESTIGLLDREEVNSSSECSLWTLHCSDPPIEPSGSSACQSVLYRGSVTLSALAKYMDLLPEPNLYFAPENGTTSLFEMKSDLSKIFIYTNSGLKKHSDDVSLSLSYDLRGFGKVIVVDVDDEKCLQIASSQGFDGHVPQVAVADLDRDLVFMDKQAQLSRPGIHRFLAKLGAAASTNSGEEVVKATGSKPYTPNLDFINRVEAQDDEVARAVFINAPKTPEFANVPAVLKETFQDIVQDAQLKMVLYYLPYDAVSMAFLSDFDKAANILASDKDTQDVLARVNCFDATDLCARENITTYPVIRIYKKYSNYQAYEGPLDMGFIVKAVRLLKKNYPWKLEDEAQLKDFVNAQVADLTPSSVVFVAPKEDRESWTVFRNAEKHLAPFVAMAKVQGSLVNAMTKRHGCSAPCVVSFHHTDSIQPVKTLSNISGVDDVIGFVKLAMVPTMPELTADNFPILHSKNLPFVILFLNQSSPTSGEIKSTISNLALMHPFQESIFCWMDVQNGTMGMVLLKEYTKGVATPTITVVNHKQAKVFTHNTETLNSNKIVQWLTDVFNGKKNPSKLLKEKKWSPPGPHYDFLKMIDEFHEEVQNEEQESNENKSSPGNNVVIEKEKAVRRKLLKRHSNVGLEGSESGAGSNMEEATQQESHENIHEHAEL